MALLELMDQLKSKGVKISLTPNYKKYYNTFPHVIRFDCGHGKDWAKMRALHRTTIGQLLLALPNDDFKSRSEYYTLNIYCLDLHKVLSAIPIGLLKQWGLIELGQMEDLVQEESNVRPDLPKAKTTVVKRLPFNNYRYRVHWPSNYRVFQKIGRESVGAIIDQINNDPNSKGFDKKITDKIKNGHHWGTSYFYTNSEDILCIISLINPLFIKRIEKFTTLEELNEKTIS